MRMLVTIAMLAGCSTSKPAPTQSAGSNAATPPKPAAAAAPRRLLDHVDALAYLPADLDGVAVASSYQDLVDAFGATAMSALPTPPVGLARDRPIGIAWWGYGSGPVLFGTIVSEHALDSAVPAERLAVRGSLAFISDDVKQVAFERMTDKIRLDTTSEFIECAAALRGGELVAAWTLGRCVGITREAETLYVQTTGTIAMPKPAHDDPKSRKELLEFQAGYLKGAKLARLKAEMAKTDHAYAALDAARDALIAAVAKDLGLTSAAKPVDDAVAPQGGLAAWAKHVATSWQAIAALDKAAHTAETRAKRASRGSDPDGDDEEVTQAVEALTVDPNHRAPITDIADPPPSAGVESGARVTTGERHAR